jgi:hypothetical protein
MTATSMSRSNGTLSILNQVMRHSEAKRTKGTTPYSRRGNLGGGIRGRSRRTPHACEAKQTIGLKFDSDQNPGLLRCHCALCSESTTLRSRLCSLLNIAQKSRHEHRDWL